MGITPFIIQMEMPKGYLLDKLKKSTAEVQKTMPTDKPRKEMVLGITTETGKMMIATANTKMKNTRRISTKKEKNLNKKRGKIS